MENREENRTDKYYLKPRSEDTNFHLSPIDFKFVYCTKLSSYPTVVCLKYVLLHNVTL